ncbi:hypothetical protein [Bifidobacterium sp. ESL0790]|uniref:hypothetical protein n=1 Tax=Bifidobacterium sp. ESL0790 TaxID=2983233 RepID=UPI0023FA0723|nr:hypothetical protein [Bifidobacterium sp. ESL0790]WEV72197.1 hypothetical protein OZY47_07105 [Bifidobacterium sp. ESL0790]
MYLARGTDGIIPGSNLDINGFLPSGHTQAVAFWATVVFWIVMFILTPKILSLAFPSAKDQLDINMSKATGEEDSAPNSTPDPAPDPDPDPDPEMVDEQGDPQIFSDQGQRRRGSFFGSIKSLKNLPVAIGLLGLFLITPMVVVFVVLGMFPASNIGGGIVQGTFWTGLVTVALMVYAVKRT